MGRASKNTIDYYILPNKITFSIYGLWPSDEKRSTKQKVFAVMHVVISLILLCTILVPDIFTLSSNWRDLSVLAGAGTMALTLSQLLFKTVYLMAKRESAYRLLQELKSLWDSTRDPVERQSYEVYAYWGRACSIVFFLWAVGTTSLFTLTATLDSFKNVESGNGSNRHLPYDVWQELDFLRSPEFEVMYACQMIGSCNCCCAIAGWDGLCLTVILYLAGQFRLITTWLTNIGIEMNCKAVHLRDSPVKVATDLVKCIRHHQRLIKVVKDINALLTPILFIQILTSGLLFCLSGFAVLSNNAGDNLVKFVFVFMYVVMQLVLYCWPGEILIQESQQVGYAAYVNVPWYQLPSSCRRQLILMIMESQNGSSMSALTFKSVCSRTLANVFNTGCSYFAVLRRVQDTSTGQ